jgi:hypothetical protein
MDPEKKSIADMGKTRKQGTGIKGERARERDSSAIASGNA